MRLRDCKLGVIVRDVSNTVDVIAGKANIGHIISLTTNEMGTVIPVVRWATFKVVDDETTFEWAIHYDNIEKL